MAGKRWHAADNMRALLIFCVIFVHLLGEGLPDDRDVNSVIAPLRLIAIPGFVFLSGYYAKNAERGAERAIVSLFFPYIVFTLMYELVALGKPLRETDIFVPAFSYWYLVALFFWRLLAGGLKRLRFALPLTLLLALSAGFVWHINSTLAISRTICFMPYFAAGLKCTPEHIRRVKAAPRAGFAVLAAAVIALAVCVQRAELFDIRALWLNANYLTYAPTNAVGFLVRLFSYPLSFALIAAMINLVPDRELPLVTGIGRRTIVPYVLHAYVVCFAGRLLFTPAVTGSFALYTALCLVLAAATLLFFSLPVWDRAYAGLLQLLNALLLCGEREAAIAAVREKLDLKTCLASAAALLAAVVAVTVL